MLEYLGGGFDRGGKAGGIGVVGNAGDCNIDVQKIFEVARFLEDDVEAFSEGGSCDFRIIRKH